MGLNSYYYTKKNAKPDSFIEKNNTNHSYKIYDRSKSMAYWVKYSKKIKLYKNPKIILFTAQKLKTKTHKFWFSFIS